MLPSMSIGITLFADVPLVSVFIIVLSLSWLHKPYTMEFYELWLIWKPGKSRFCRSLILNKISVDISILSKLYEILCDIKAIHYISNMDYNLDFFYTFSSKPYLMKKIQWLCNYAHAWMWLTMLVIKLFTLVLTKFSFEMNC